jgi:hypothetical protein
MDSIQKSKDWSTIASTEALLSILASDDGVRSPDCMKKWVIHSAVKSPGGKKEGGVGAGGFAIT